MSTAPEKKTENKTLSPAELAKLEHAFATDPSSDAYRPLAEAYLGMGRFMEAMVVCKKGVKAHPNRPDPRLLLARVYADQGKDKKALEELQGALTIAPTDKAVLRMTGALQLKGGEAETGKQNLLKAYEADPTDAETLASMQQFKVEVPKKAAPVPDAPTERVQTLQQGGPPVLHPQPQHTNGSSGPQTPRRTGQRMAMNGVANATTTPPRASGQRAAQRYEEPYYEEPSIHRVQHNKSRAAFYAVGPVLLLFLVGYFAWGQYNGKKQRDLKHHLYEVQHALEDDSYASYQKACAEADEALNVDSSSVLAQGYAAYAWAVRWGEHGGGDDARRQAEEHLAIGKKIGDPDAHLAAADALLKLYAGKTSEAEADLEAEFKNEDAQGRTPGALLLSTMALVQMNAGDLEKALESITKAQAAAPSDPRIYGIKGDIYRRRGEEKEAKDAFNAGLKYKGTHPESLLGRAIIWSEGEDARGYAPAASVLAKFIDSEPPPSPRQLAVAHMTRTLVMARMLNASATKPDQLRALAEATRLPAEPGQLRSEIKKDDDAAVGLDASNPELHIIRGRRAEIEGKLEDAAVEIKSAIRMDQSSALPYVQLAEVLLRKQDGAKEAEIALAQAPDSVRQSPRVMFVLGLVYRKENRPDDAIAQFRKAVDIPKSKNPEARMSMADVYMEKKDLGNAEVQITKAIEELLGTPGPKLGEAYVLRARINEAKGGTDRNKATNDYEHALSVAPDYAPAYLYYARYLNAGDATSKAKARLTAAEYLRLDPTGPFQTEAQALAR